MTGTHGLRANPAATETMKRSAEMKSHFIATLLLLYCCGASSGKNNLLLNPIPMTL